MIEIMQSLFMGYQIKLGKVQTDPGTNLGS